VLISCTHNDTSLVVLQVDLVLVMLLQSWVRDYVIWVVHHMIHTVVYACTNLFTYFNDYLMCKSVGTSLGGTKVSLFCGLVGDCMLTSG